MSENIIRGTKAIKDLPSEKFNVGKNVVQSLQQDVSLFRKGTGLFIVCR